MSGIFGAVSDLDCAKLLFYGTDYHSHLGTEFGGIAILGKEFQRRIHDIRHTQFKSKFFEDYHKMQGTKGIGVISAKYEQPIYLNSKFGPLAICLNGHIDNQDELAAEMMHQSVTFSEISHEGVNPIELVAKMITRCDSIVEGIEHVFDKVKGSCSILLLNKDGIYAARDKFGYTPLVVGKRGQDWAVTSESCAFTNLGFEVQKFIGPGEIVLINEEGAKEKNEVKKNCQICAFLWIYTGFPASSYEGINVECVRERCGRFLAKRDDVKADVVSGVPDSGIAHAIGYAMESGAPYRRPLVKYTPGYGRSYTPPSQETRDLIAKMKLIPIKEVIDGKRIVVCEDSIVRGTQLKNFTINKLWENGAKEIHVRPACPPLMFPCRFNLSTRSISELAARKAIKAIEGRDIEDVSEYLDATSEKYRKMIEWITRDLDITTLRYLAVDDMVKAIGLEKEKLCLYCWTGESPQWNNS